MDVTGAVRGLRARPKASGRRTAVRSRKGAAGSAPARLRRGRGRPRGPTPGSLGDACSSRAPRLMRRVHDAARTETWAGPLGLAALQRSGLARIAEGAAPPS